jgi:hypothetical protein
LAFKQQSIDRAAQDDSNSFSSRLAISAFCSFNCFSVAAVEDVVEDLTC